VFYAIDAAGLGATIAWLLNDCCMDHPDVVSRCRHGRAAGEPDLHPARSA
jgi:hypothetical protein